MEASPENQQNSAPSESTTKISRGINYLLNLIGILYLFNGMYGCILYIVLYGYDDIIGENGSTLIFICFANSIITSIIYFEAAFPNREIKYQIAPSNQHQSAQTQKQYKLQILLKYIYWTLKYLRCISNEFIFIANTFVNIIFQVVVCPFAENIFGNESPNYVSLFIQITVLVSLARIFLKFICFISVKDDFKLAIREEQNTRSDAFEQAKMPAFCFSALYFGFSTSLYLYYQKEKIEFKVIILLSLIMNLFSLLETVFVIYRIYEKLDQQAKKDKESDEQAKKDKESDDQAEQNKKSDDQQSGTKLFMSLQISAHPILTFLQAFQGIAEVSLFIALIISFAVQPSEIERAPFQILSLYYLFTLSLFIKCGMLISSDFREAIKKARKEKWPSFWTTDSLNDSKRTLLIDDTNYQVKLEKELQDYFDKDVLVQLMKNLKEPIQPQVRACSICQRSIKKNLGNQQSSCQKNPRHLFHIACIEKWRAKFPDTCVNCKYEGKNERDDEQNILL